MEIDSNVEENFRELGNCERLVLEKMETLTKNIRFIQSHVDQGAQETLCFYSENNKILSQTIEQESKEKNQFTSMLSVGRAEIDVESLKLLRDSPGGIVDLIGKLKALSLTTKKEEGRKEVKARIIKDVQKPIGEYAEEPYQSYSRKQYKESD